MLNTCSWTWPNKQLIRWRYEIYYMITTTKHKERDINSTLQKRGFIWWLDIKNILHGINDYQNHTHNWSTRHLLLTQQCTWNKKYSQPTLHDRDAFEHYYFISSLTFKSNIFSDVTLCSVVHVYWYFRGMYYLHLWGRTVRQASTFFHSMCTQASKYKIHAFCLTDLCSWDLNKPKPGIGSYNSTHIWTCCNMILWSSHASSQHH
jgi:hypothetical protein